MVSHKHEFGAPWSFTDFFEWTPLPSATVRYILTQSSEVGFIHRYVNKSLDGDSDESTSGELDVFTIKSCIALRGPSLHHGVMKRQFRSLDEIGEDVRGVKSLK